MNTVETVSQRLYEAFRQIAPPPDEWASRARKARPKLRAEDFSVPLARFHDLARELRREHRLGIVARARVVLNLQRRLSAAGYPAEMSRPVLFAMILEAFVGKV